MWMWSMEGEGLFYDMRWISEYNQLMDVMDVPQGRGCEGREEVGR